jgi:DNA-binding NarL/FixJ family response regulator
MNIIIADDHAMFRFGLVQTLKLIFPDVNAIEFENGNGVVRFFEEQNRADLILLDIDMPIKNGIDTAREVREIQPDVFIVVLSMHNDAEIVEMAFYNGVNGYLLKENSSKDLEECIRTIFKGERFLAPSLVQNPRSLLLQKNRLIDSVPNLQTLTKTERKVLKLISQKYNSSDIAELMNITVNSVENYRNRICRKLDLDAKHNSLLMWALEYRFLL